MFLGTAGLVGCVTGAVVFLIFKVASSTLKIDVALVPQTDAMGRTAAEYRVKKRAEKTESKARSPGHTPVILKKVPRSRQRGLLSQAVAEEEESDF